MASSFRGWLKSELTVAAYRLAYLASGKALFPKPSAEGEILFILGSGSSVDNLEPKHWDLIAKETSIGINFWTTHTFFPNYYALEKAYGNRVQALEPLVYDRRKVRGARVLWFSGPNRINRRLLRVFKRHGGKVWFYSGWPLYKDGGRGLTGKFFHLYRVFQRLPRPLRPALDAGNTVSRLVTMASMNGWKKIVLLGVDLGGAYFSEYVAFSETVANTTNRGMSQGVTPDGKHDVDASKRGEFRLSEFLARLDSWMREIGAGKILDGTVQGDGRLGLEQFKW